MRDDISINLKLVSDALPELVANALDRAGYVIENKSKENCPVDTGILRSSINHIVENNMCVIGTNIEYAAAVHEGHGSWSGNPFLEEAFNTSIADVQACFEGLLERGSSE